LRWATVLANGIFSFQKGRFWYVVRPWNWKFWYRLWPYGILVGHLLYFAAKSVLGSVLWISVVGAKSAWSRVAKETNSHQCKWCPDEGLVPSQIWFVFQIRGRNFFSRRDGRTGRTLRLIAGPGRAWILRAHVGLGIYTSGFDFFRAWVLV
jgi:hypothetical protein